MPLLVLAGGVASTSTMGVVFVAGLDGRCAMRDLSPSARLLVTLVVGGIVALALPERVAVQTRLLAVWDASVLVFLALLVMMMAGKTPAEVQERARRLGDGKGRVLAVVVVTSAASLGAVAVMLNDIERHAPGYRTHVNLSIAAVFGSWFLLQTMFALFYARHYWQPPDDPEDTTFAGGLEFASAQAPDYWDFVYFSFTLGMCYQTSDISIGSRRLRRVALLHIIMSFLFYTVIIGMVMNAIGSLL
jgi:uncharacterized membrane protein